MSNYKSGIEFSTNQIAPIWSVHPKFGNNGLEKYSRYFRNIIVHRQKLREVRFNNFKNCEYIKKHVLIENVVRSIYCLFPRTHKTLIALLSASSSCLKCTLEIHICY